ncbi:MAG: low molecular weight protein tyrosine phosphatase family protein [Proteobacteria bacterium]|nr:low molecular weight protein tyrosine phosphatase family protein [Pseudomonadota bacterium]
MRRVLFVCSQNRLRSPTAEQVFADWPGLEVASAGLDATAETPLSGELLEWAEIVFTMERVHSRKLAAKFGRHLRRQRVICLDIPDIYKFMDPQLVEILRIRVPRLLGTVGPPRIDS